MRNTTNLPKTLIIGHHHSAYSPKIFLIFQAPLTDTIVKWLIIILQLLSQDCWTVQFAEYPCSCVRCRCLPKMFPHNTNPLILEWQTMHDTPILSPCFFGLYIHVPYLNGHIISYYCILLSYIYSNYIYIVFYNHINICILCHISSPPTIYPTISHDIPM